MTINDRAFVRIGSGFCGSVWTPISDDHPQFGDAFKRGDGGPGRSLTNDFEMQNCTINALTELSQLGVVKQESLSILVPNCYALIHPTHDWWQANLASFPTGYTPCNVMRSERILPVAKQVRHILVESFCPEALRADIKASAANEVCLIRPYLGRRRVHGDSHLTSRPRRFSAFSLRNFPLHIDQMESLGIGLDDMTAYSQTMARTLATIHWLGEMDGNDVEFVLAPPRRLPNGQGAAIVTLSNVLGEHALWLLDFDCCNKISLDEAGVDAAVRAFLWNDPFYPQPRSSETLWNAFSEEYLKVSTIVLRHRQLGRESLPELFIAKIEESCHRP